MRTDAALWSIAAEILKETQAAQQDQRCHPSSPRSRATQRDYSRSTRFLNAGWNGVVRNKCALGAGDKRRRQKIPAHVRSMQGKSSEQKCLLADSDLFSKNGCCRLAYWSRHILLRACTTLSSVGSLDRRYEASAKRLRQQGHSPSYPLTRAANADGCGRVMIALNANGAR